MQVQEKMHAILVINRSHYFKAVHGYNCEHAVCPSRLVTLAAIITDVTILCMCINVHKATFGERIGMIYIGPDKEFWQGRNEHLNYNVIWRVTLKVSLTRGKHLCGKQVIKIIYYVLIFTLWFLQRCVHTTLV